MSFQKRTRAAVFYKIPLRWPLWRRIMCPSCRLATWKDLWSCCWFRADREVFFTHRLNPKLQQQSRGKTSAWECWERPWKLENLQHKSFQLGVSVQKYSYYPSSRFPFVGTFQHPGQLHLRGKQQISSDTQRAEYRIQQQERHLPLLSLVLTYRPQIILK